MGLFSFSKVYPRLGIILIAATLFVAETGFAGTLSVPAVDSYNVRVGTETFAAMYQFTTNTALVETAEAITNMGSDTIKLYMGSDTSGQEGVTLTSNITNLMTLARDEPSYHQVLDMPFRHYVMWEYPFANSDEWWGSGYNATQGAKDYQEMYSLTQYLLTNYNNSGKTFYLGHWEGDGYLEVNGWTTNPSPATISGMIGWLNNRQKAVDDAKAATTFSNVYVYNYSECNRVRDAMNNGTNNNQRVINYVVPYVTNLDYLSYSSYDSQNLSQANLYTTLNYMQSMLPTNKASVVPGCRMWIGEYGWGTYTTAQQEPMNRDYIQRLIGWSDPNGFCLPFILFWEMFSNYNPGGGTNYCLIDYTDTKTPSWYLQNYFFNDARLTVAQFNETNHRLPTDTEFSSLMSPLLNQPLAPPTNLTLRNISATMTSGSTATVSGSLAQGVYGDTEALVTLFYGLQDGGTNLGAWQSSHFVAVNTNFNQATYNVPLAGLAANTNYYYRFYAANQATNAWAPATSQFSTLAVNSNAYGASMKITFDGYNRSETLSNFPALVNLGTNLPGFSYRQFASPTGGDLRFTDSGGVLLIPHEIDEWNTNGTSSVWVNVPALSATNNSIWAYWGNPAATNVPSYSTNGSAWPNYLIVYHLKQSGFPYADSTLNYPALSGVAPTLTTGEIGHAEYFDGKSCYLDAGNVTMPAGAFTLSAWVNVAITASSCQGIWCNQKGGFGSAGFSLFVNSYQTNNGALLMDTGTGSAGGEIATAAGAVPFGQWHQISATVNRTNGTISLYVDGNNTPIVSGGVTANFNNIGDLNLGRFTNSSLYFTGLIDEARIHEGVDSSNWVWANWMTTTENSAFASYSTVTRPAPNLQVGNGPTGALISWPATGTGFALYTTTNLARPSWTPATNQVTYSNNQWQANVPPGTNAVRFYRLQSE